MRALTRNSRALRRPARRGVVLPMIVICIVALVGMLALAIDIGMVAVARSQAQNAADSAAMAGARTINGTSSYNYSQVPVNAILAATDNNVFGNAIQGDSKSFTNPSADVYNSKQVTVSAGSYAYVYNDSNPSAEGFQIVVPGKSASEPYSAVKVDLQSSSPVSFGKIFSNSGFAVASTATAVHRPRDVIIIMDLSGSMRFQSLNGLYVHTDGLAYPTYGMRNTSMNPDPDYPRFGPYSATSSAALYGTTSYSTGAEMCDPSNLTYASNSGPAILDDFYSSGSTKAFTRGSAAYCTNPNGDDYPKYNSAYVATANAYLNSVTTDTAVSNFLVKGLQYYGEASIDGYSEGPSYWGKTFFVWPPDPRGTDLDPTVAANHANNGAKDWRQRFFFKYNTTSKTLGWLDHNNLLFNPAGTPMTNTTATTPIMQDPDTVTTVTENGATVSYQLRINYAAILYWLTKQTPVHFPSQLVTGRISYYTSIPDASTDTTINARFWTNTGLSSNEQFWREYIDFMLGYVASGGTYNNVLNSVPYTALIGNGDMFKWGTTAIQIKQRPDSNYFGQINKTGGFAAGISTIIVDNVKTSASTPAATNPVVGNFVRIGYGSTIFKIKTATLNTPTSGSHTLVLDRIDTANTTKGLAGAIADNTPVQFYTAAPKYMDHADNPYRPKHQFWFGPMTFGDWLGNYSTNKFWWPGNIHEAQAWACKVGIQTAIDDIKNNHPNDFIGMTFFSDPRTSATDTSGWHNRAVVPLGRNYDQLKDSLWFPATTVTGSATTINPYSSDMDLVPRANGGTAPGMGLMIAYNQLSNSVALRNYAQPSATYRGNAGGLGRKGANRLIIFETDGAPNTRAAATLASSGANTYYQIRVKMPDTISDASNEFPTGGTYASSDIYSVVQQITALDTASPPGYSNSRKPALVYSIGYGSLFDPANSSASQTNALTFLQTVQYYGNTAKTTSASDFPDWQRIYGTNTQRISRLQSAFTTIMQSGIQVSLIQ